MSRRRDKRKAPPMAAPQRPAGVDAMLLARAGASTKVEVDFDAVDKMLGVPSATATADARLASARRRDKDDQQLANLAQRAAAQPDSVERLFALATMQRKLERNAEALASFRRILALAPDRKDVEHMVAALSGEASPARASDEFVREEFDAFAERFDETLTTWLDYRAPEIVRDAVLARLGVPVAGETVIDLGCGTGLAAPLIKPFARRLEGVDLSPRMIEKAKARGLYDALHVDEIMRFLAARNDRYTLAIACDVFCYFGELAPVFAAVRASLQRHGVFVFTVERHEDEGFLLQPNGRYAHGHGFVLEAVAQAGLMLARSADVKLRTEALRPVMGGCYVVTRG
jgi:predicted TPR repeat methyltransferase